MDEMRLKLSTKFMRNIVSKLISKLLSKELGYKVSIQLNDLDVWVINGDTTVKADVELKMNSEEFKKLVTKLGDE